MWLRGYCVLKSANSLIRRQTNYVINVFEYLTTHSGMEIDDKHELRLVCKINTINKPNSF